MNVKFFVNDEIIEVRLRNGYETYFKQEYKINNPKDIKRMVRDLQDKGVNLPLSAPAWFD